MSLYTALSGLSAAQTDLSVTSNNIANSATTGFRGSRVNFGDIYSHSPALRTAVAVGGGVSVQNVQQEFRQGAIIASGNTLDLAIDGPGFFAVRPSASSQMMAFSRAGAFALDKANRVTDPAGQVLLAFPTARDGSLLSGDLGQAQPLTVPPSWGEPVRTTVLSMALTLPGGGAAAGAQDAVPPSRPFDPADPSTFAAATALTVFDADGKPAQAVVHFIRTQDPTASLPETLYRVELSVAGTPLTADAPMLRFDGAGQWTGEPLQFQGNGATGPLTLDPGGTVLGADGFSVQSAMQDGAPRADLAGMEVDTSGTVWASYADGQSLALGRVAMAGFTNPGGLSQIGNATWAATGLSGDPRAGAAGQDGLGTIRSGALEGSNVDVTKELVDLITEQRNYQASAKALQTMSTVEQAILSIQS